MEGKKADSECIQVVVRCRPFNTKEKERNSINIIDVDTQGRQITIKNPANMEEQKSFTFDATYDENAQQRAFYEESCFNLVENVLEGFNGTVFAYGQTGCGKSWTMQGPPSPPDMRGVIPNSFAHIFEHINASKHVEFLVRCSYLELYNEEIKDLLCDPKSKLKCEIKEDPQKGIFVKNLSDVIVENKEDLDAMFEKGLSIRTVAATLMNAESSRSHSIFSIVVEMSTRDETGKDHIRAGKLNLVDLAGSERQKKTGATGALLKEGSKINLSLSVLGNVISALAENKGKHVPYRDSKLTRLLQDSLGGNTKTLMVAAISPADYNYDETMSTLRYANRAKNITNKPKINEDPKDALLREYKEEIEQLRRMLAEHQSKLASMAAGGGGGGGDMAAMMMMQQSLLTAVEAVSQAGSSPRQISKPSKLHRSVREALQDNPVDGQQEERSVGPSPEPPEHSVSPRPKNRSPRRTFSNGVDDKENLQSRAQEALVGSEDGDEEYADDVAQMNYDDGDEKASIGSSKSNKAVTSRESKPESPDLKVMEAIAQERDKAHQQLRSSQEEVEKERKLREDLLHRLEDLQGKLVGNDIEDAKKASPSKSRKDQEKEERERAEAEEAYRQRKALAKKKKETRMLELQRVKNEKQAVEEELDELRRSAAQWASNDANNGNEEAAVAFEKKLTKLKKKYDKKVQGIRQENEELKEEFEYQRQQLQDVLDEQDKDLKLYEAICVALLGEKELKKVLDRSNWNEQDECWELPFIKRKHLDASNNRALESTSKGKFLPDIKSKMVPDQTSGYSGSGNNGSLSARAALSGGPDLSIAGSNGLSGANNNQGCRSRSGSRRKNRDKERDLDAGSRPQSHLINADGLVKPTESPVMHANSPVPPVPILMVSSNSNSNNNGIASLESAPKKKTKKKKKAKQKKPDEMLDVAGSGISAGDIANWGFAYDGPGDGFEQDDDGDNVYSDDDDFEKDGDGNAESSGQPPYSVPKPNRT